MTLMGNNVSGLKPQEPDLCLFARRTARAWHFMLGVALWERVFTCLEYRAQHRIQMRKFDDNLQRDHQTF